MTNRISIAVMVVLLGSACLLAEVARSQVASDGRQLVVYRGSDGRLSDESRELARVLVRKALANGTVELWLTLNYPFQTNVEALSPADREAQEAAVRSGFRELLAPLVARRMVFHPNGTPAVFVNGCRVTATARGVRRLVFDRRVLHMVEIPSR